MTSRRYLGLSCTLQPRYRHATAINCDGVLLCLVVRSSSGAIQIAATHGKKQYGGGMQLSASSFKCMHV